MTNKTIAVVNSTGRQTAAVIRVASAVGYHVRAQLRDREGIVAEELEGFRNVTLIEGPLEDPEIVKSVFRGAQLAFINTTAWGDEVTLGKSLANAAKKAGIQHYIYSSMPDHGAFGRNFPSLPLWSTKFAVENYIRQIGLPATFVYAGIYNNNFTSLPYPLFSMELQPDDSIQWVDPFHPDIPLPWLDAEHDVGPAVIQILKDGLRKWSGHRYELLISPHSSYHILYEGTDQVSCRIALAFEVLTPRQVCAAFARALNRPVRYKRGQIEVRVSIPGWYKEQLEGLQVLFGEHNAPYFGPELAAPDEARSLWEGYRGMEEYAREVFPVEEANNGLTWMN